MKDNTTILDEDIQNSRFLELFISTIEEYKRMTISLSVDWNNKFHEEITPEDYSAIHIRAMLIRKYITKSDNVHLKKVRDKAKSLLPSKATQIEDIYQEFFYNYNEQIIQTLESGEELSLRETFDDVIYGLFLHADFDRSSRLSKSNESMRFFCLKRFIHSVENSIFNLYDLLIDCGINGYVKAKSEHSASAIALIDQKRNAQKDVTGFWSTLYGRDTNFDEAFSYLIDSKTPEEQQMMFYSILFLTNLSEGKSKLENMEYLVSPLNINDWGDFSEAQSYINSIPDYGIGSTVNYNEYRDVAYIKILSNVERPFIIDQHQIISSYSFTFIKNELDNTWRIYSFGGRIDPLQAIRHK